MGEELEEALSDSEKGSLVSSCDPVHTTSANNAVTNPISIKGSVFLQHEDNRSYQTINKGRLDREEVVARGHSLLIDAITDKILVAAVEKFNCRNWKKIAECVPDRTDVQCLHRWQKVLNPDLVKGTWKKEEDALILDLVVKQGNKKWSEIAKHLPGRIGKQCRERWYNHLNPEIKRTAWTKEEELTLIKAHKIYGNKWAELAKFLHGRKSDNNANTNWSNKLINASSDDVARLQSPELSKTVNSLHSGALSVPLTLSLTTPISVAGYDNKTGEFDFKGKLLEALKM
ncbi:hypothetical protein GH714_019805 [Hevea brasiliensis]|uniref:Uncharacterized protein n=1 Tax=Hevea brasiliensis TaxID=3981 RepID=A0A6A6MFL0_HEVBR|nr:hypothetical protein GH714_019805 [Hevea brasiliensis]